MAARTEPALASSPRGRRDGSNPTDLDDSVQTGFDWQYSYDDLDRLLRAQAGTLSGGSIGSETRDQNFSLDHPGNLTHIDLDLNADGAFNGVGEYDWDFTHNKANEITEWDDQTTQPVPAHDAAGNMTDDKRDYKYEYDAFYRLVKVRNQSDDVLAEFKYNGLNHRIAARYDETAPSYNYAYDERWRMVAMYEDSDTDPTEQFWPHSAGLSGMSGSSYIDDVVLRDRDTDGNGSLDERLFYCQNWHHDVVALVDTSGSVSERANYDAYGKPIGTFTSVNNRKGYAGYEIDPNLTELYHVRHRVLNAKIGRWTRRDPLGYVDGPNTYFYAWAAPQSSLDPTGRSCWEDYDVLGECLACCLDEFADGNYHHSERYVKWIQECTYAHEKRKLPIIPFAFDLEAKIIPCGSVKVHSIRACSIDLDFEGKCFKVEAAVAGWKLLGNTYCGALESELLGEGWIVHCPSGCECIDKKEYTGEHLLTLDVRYRLSDDCVAHVTGELILTLTGEVGKCDCEEVEGPLSMPCVDRSADL